MRKLPLSLQISAAVHALVVTWLVSRLPAEKPPVPPTPKIELIEVAPVEVTFLDVPATAAIPEAAPEAVTVAPEARPDRTRDDRRAETAAITTGAATSTTGAATAGTIDTGTGTTEPTPGTPGKKNPLLDMRKGAPVRLTVGVPTGRWDGREHAPETYGPDIDSGKLAPSGGGTFRSDEGVFTAKVDRDGSVSLKDSKNFNIRFALPRPKQVGRAVASWYTDKNKPVGQLPPDKSTNAPVLNNGEATGQYDRKPDHGEAPLPIVSGGFDVTDALMRQKGIDPYAAKKLAYLDSTRDQRVQIGQRHRARQLEQAAVIMKGNLDRVWSLPTPEARREALFELWDECAETGIDELVAAGREARRLVIGVIRARLPAGSADAFTAADLAAFNRKKQSKATFAPY